MELTQGEPGEDSSSSCRLCETTREDAKKEILKLEAKVSQLEQA